MVVFPSFRLKSHDLTLRPPPSNSGVIIGASSLKQLKQNLDAIERGTLPPDILEACEKAWEVMAGARPLYYHGEYKYQYDTIKALYGEGAL